MPNDERLIAQYNMQSCISGCTIHSLKGYSCILEWCSYDFNPQ